MMSRASKAAKYLMSQYSVAAPAEKRGWGIFNKQYIKKQLTEFLQAVIDGGEEILMTARSTRADYRKDLICGFRFFIGDAVRLTEESLKPFDSGVGFVQWVNIKERMISIRFKRGSMNSYAVVSPDQVERVGEERGVPTLISSTDLKKVYQQMSFNEKCFFHYNRGRSVKEIADIASVSVDKVKSVLRARKDQIVYEANVKG